MYDQLMSNTGCTTNVVEAMHHGLGSTLPKSPSMALWFDHVTKDERRTSSLLAQASFNHCLYYIVSLFVNNKYRHLGLIGTAGAKRDSE